MNAAPIVLLSVALAAGASVVTSYALQPDPQPVAAAETAPDELASLRRRVETLTNELEEFRRQGGERALPAATSTERVQMAAIDEAVRRYFEEHIPGAIPESASSETDAQQPTEAVATAAELYALLEDADLDEEGRQEIWNRIRESGQLDDVIALLEERAEKFSDDPDAQVDVASGYIQKIFEVGEGPEAGLWAGKADKAYDRALALDDRHWDARFNKAISLSFWPPIFGKQREAISHFETLISQQENGAPEDRHAQSYLLLGNLYAQSGDTEKAEATWKQGLGLFPGDESLTAKFPGQ